MSNRSGRVQKFFASFLTIGLLSAVTCSALSAPPPSDSGNIHLDNERNWHFGCFPERETLIGEFPPPNILLMLDVSGSMNDRDPGTQYKRLLRAKYALLALADANQSSFPRIAYFGMGHFPYQGYRQSLSAIMDIPCGDGNVSELREAIRKQQAGGGTPTHGAIELAASDACNTVLKKNQSSATAVITDGSPNSPGRTIEQACIHRRVAPVYAIGLGRGTNESFNNMMAAAGGTGTCQTFSGQNWDPCDNLGNLQQGVTCTGSYSTNATSELIDALRGIAAKVSCNFPLETAGIDPRKIPTDASNVYPFVKVQLHTKGSSDRVLTYSEDASTPQARQNQQDGWTWKFTNSEKNSVSLGAAACEAIKKQQVTSVKTQLGCICLEEPGSQCGGISVWGKQVCPPGTFTCDRGKDICDGAEQNRKTDIPCQTASVGICSNGHLECVNGTDQCLPNNRPMPEVCDGVDNDCDGRDDDIMTSWRNPKFQTELEELQRIDAAGYKYYRDQRACQAQNRCVCPTLTSPEVKVPMSSEDLSKQYSSYAAYSMEQRGDCYCQIF